MGGPGTRQARNRGEDTTTGDLNEDNKVLSISIIIQACKAG